MDHQLIIPSYCGKCRKWIGRGAFVSQVGNPLEGEPVQYFHFECSPIAEDRERRRRPEPRCKVSEKYFSELLVDDRTLTLCAVSVACTLLLMAASIKHLPPDFFDTLRWIVCIAFGIILKQMWHSPDRVSRWFFLAATLVYNPIAVPPLDGSTWRMLDVLAVLMLIYGQYVKRYYEQYAER